MKFSKRRYFEALSVGRNIVILFKISNVDLKRIFDSRSNPNEPE